MDTAAEFPFLLFEFADREGTIQPLCFVNPTKIIQTNAIDEVRTALQAVERACNEGYYAACFIAYEAAPAFDPAYAVVPGDPSLPLLWFGLFDKPLFAVEAYPTVWQMTSTITATTRADTTLDDVFAALFPCGSITGAPKISTMKKIAELEDSPRGVYCGAVGYMTPDHTRVFNVAIRTVVLDASTGVAEYGAGGGITWNSEAQEEYTETLTKAAILTETVPAFELLETMRLEQGQYALLDRHLRRLAKSARYFDIPLDLPRVQEQLDEHARAFDSFARRVRLLVSQDGQIRIESTALSPSPLESRFVALANRPVSRYNRFLYHKTTCRDVYEALQSEHPDALDVLLWNEQGEITEFTIGNVVLNIRGELLTPARESGLLDGTLRAELLEQGVVRAATITLSELASARQIWLINSVRGWIPVHFYPSSVLTQNVLQR